MNQYFNNKIALVTGAASGIGLALSKQLVQIGCKVYMADIQIDQLREHSTKLGTQANSMKLDVSNRSDFQDAVNEVIKIEGRIDFLFNNAGIGMAGQFDGYTEHDWNRIIDINIKGVVNGCSIVYPIMKEQNNGHIINTASLAGLLPTGLIVPYVTTKHAVVGLSRGLRQEAILHNVSVSVLCPGTIETAMLDSSTPKDMPQKTKIDVRSYLIKITGKAMTADKFAEKAIKLLPKKKELIFIPAKSKEMWTFGRFFPKKLSKLANKAVREELNS